MKQFVCVLYTIFVRVINNLCGFYFENIVKARVNFFMTIKHM